MRKGVYKIIVSAMVLAVLASPLPLAIYQETEYGIPMGKTYFNLLMYIIGGFVAITGLIIGIVGLIDPYKLHNQNQNQNEKSKSSSSDN